MEPKRSMPLKKILAGKGYATSVGDEGGFAPELEEQR